MSWLHHLLDATRSKVFISHSGGSEAISRVELSESVSADAVLGKARKLLRQCRRELAIQWYIRSFAEKRARKSTLHELFAAGFAADVVERLAAVILTQTRTCLPAGSPELLWDVTPLWLSCRAGRPADREALWSFRCGLALARGMPLKFAFFDVTGGEIRELTEHGTASLTRGSEATADSFPSISDFEGARPIAAKPTVLFSSPHWSLPADRVDCIFRPYLQKNAALIAVLRNLDAWTWPEWFSPSRHAALRAVQKLYVANASSIFVESNLGVASVHSVMKAAGLPAHPLVVPLPLAATVSFPAERTRESVGKTVLVLTPHDPAELRSILAAYKLAPTAALRFLADDDGVEPDQTIARFVADNPDLDVSEIPAFGSRVQNEMHSAASLLVPKSRSDGELWIKEAAEAGVAVFCMVGRPIPECWNGAVSGFLSSSDPRNFARQWLHAQSRRKQTGIRAQVAREAVEEIRRNMTEAAGRATVAQQLDFAHQGVFYCLSSAERAPKDPRIASGIRFREGTGWGEPTPDGSPVTGAAGILRFRFWSVHPGQHRCMLLVTSSGGGACRAHCELTLGGQTAAAELRLSASEVRWIRVDFDPGPELRHDAQLAVRMVPHGPQPDGNTSLVVVGWFSYPDADDVCWFEFLDTVSAGKLPVLTRAYRRSVIDSLRSSREHAIEVPPAAVELRTSRVSDRR